MIPASFQRTLILLGDEKLLCLRDSHALVAGLGGVGSWCAEALARAGIGRISLVDHDLVAESNINRQLPALHSTIGRPKVEVMAERLADIAPDCHVTPVQAFIDAEQPQICLEPRPDVVIDAIDSLNSKVAFLETCVHRGIAVFSSMGAGNRLDPTALRSVDISRTHTCGLARQVRTRLKKRGIVSGIPVVFSVETPRPPGEIEPVAGPGRARVTNGTISYLPPLFGFTLAGLAINYLLA